MSRAQGKFVSLYQNGCGSFCQPLMRGSANDVSGDSNELFGMWIVPPRRTPAVAVKVSRPTAAERRWLPLVQPRAERKFNSCRAVAGLPRFGMPMLLVP